MKRVFEVNGRLRPIWRFFVSATLIVPAYWGVPVVLDALYHFVGYPSSRWAGLFWYHAMLLPALLWISSILARLLEGQSLAWVGLAFSARWKIEAGMGLGLGAMMIFFVAALERWLSLATFATNHDLPSRTLTAGLSACVLLLIAATNEELMFRGYPFQRLVEALGPAGAVAVSSIFFGLAHLRNPFHTWVSTMNTMLTGVLFSLAYLRTRTLWMPIGIHFSWNFFEGYALGLPVSGIILPKVLLKPAVRGVPWLAGGNYGPEGGMLTLVAIIGATLYVSFSRSIYTSKEMNELVSRAIPAEAVVAGVMPPLPDPIVQAGKGRNDRD